MVKNLQIKAIAISITFLYSNSFIFAQTSFLDYSNSTLLHSNPLNINNKTNYEYIASMSKKLYNKYPDSKKYYLKWKAFNALSISILAVGLLGTAINVKYKKPFMWTPITVAYLAISDWVSSFFETNTESVT